MVSVSGVRSRLGAAILLLTALLAGCEEEPSEHLLRALQLINWEASPLASDVNDKLIAEYARVEGCERGKVPVLLVRRAMDWGNYEEAGRLAKAALPYVGEARLVPELFDLACIEQDWMERDRLVQDYPDIIGRNYHGHFVLQECYDDRNKVGYFSIRDLSFLPTTHMAAFGYYQFVGELEESLAWASNDKREDWLHLVAASLEHVLLVEYRIYKWGENALKAGVPAGDYQILCRFCARLAITYGAVGNLEAAGHWMERCEELWAALEAKGGWDLRDKALYQHLKSQYLSVVSDTA